MLNRRTFLKTRAAAHSREYMRETTHGIYETLLRGRYAFDFVHEISSNLNGLAKTRSARTQHHPLDHPRRKHRPHRR